MKLKAPNREPLDVKLEVMYHGQAFIKINAHGDYVMLVADRSEMIGELKRLLRVLEVRSIEEVNQAEALPVELYKPETAWPWLLDRFPWLFDDISTEREPYASYLKSGAKRGTCDVCGEFVTGVTAKYCSNACKQSAYRERKAV